MYILLLLMLTLSLGAGSDNSFIPGEKLYYRAHWNNVTGGYAMVEVLSRKNTQGHEVYHFKMKARTSKLIDLMYKVRNTIDTHWNASERQPLRVSKTLTEGYTRRFYKMNFDYSKNEITHWLKIYKDDGDIFGTKRKDARWYEQRGAFKEVVPETQDYLSALYYMRSDPRKPEPGGSFNLNIYDNLKFRKVNFKVLKKEELKTHVGNFSSVKISTDFKTEGHLRSKGRILAWVSDDKYRYPLKATALIPVFGKVQVDLVTIVKPK